MNRSYINTASFANFLSKNRKLLLFVFFVLVQTAVLGQSVGDYRSAATGNWTTLSSWQYYNGTTWVTPSGTSPQGYPGQFVGTNTVLIQYGNTITMGTADLTTSSMGTLTISGELILDGGSGSAAGATFTINTQSIIVSPNLTPDAANISFANKVILSLPENATIQVGTGGLPSPGNGTCNNTIQISIGGIAYAYCTGAGSSANDFEDLMSLGGTGNATSNSPVCNGNAIYLYATPPPNGTYTYSWVGPNGFSSNSQNPAPFSASISPNTAGLYSVTMTRISDSKSILAQTSVVVNSNPTIAPVVGTITQPTCATQTGSLVISGLPASGTLNQSGTVVASYPITGASMTISGLASGTYAYTVSNGSCTSAASSNVVINTTTKTWNGSAWSPSAPTINDNIIINGNYILSSDLEVCSCQVSATGYVDVNSGVTLTLTNDLKVISGGYILFKDKSSLVQTNNLLNTGNINYERKISATIRETDYTYWSSPVAGFTLGDVYDNDPISLYYSYGLTAGVEDWQPESSSTVMTAGKGYIINGAEPYTFPSPPTTRPVFVGVPNNGDVTVIIPNNSNFSLPSTDPNFGVSYLLGNPYPSAIDADTFLTANATVLSGTIYFWTHNTAIQPTNPSDTTLGTGAFAYTSNDYATYNITGGVGIDIGSSTGPSLGGTTIPTGKIAAGQGFFATAKASGTVTFTNAMRIAGNNSQFFKKRNSKTEKIIEKNRIWLNLTNTQGAFKQTLVGYITGATNGYDDRFDGESFDGNEFVDFYSLNQDKNLVIQGRALPFDENDEIPLGYRSTINGDFTINIDQVDGLLTNQAVFLEDKLTNTITDLKSGNYTFNTVAGTFDNRFVLKYKDNSTAKTLATANFDAQANKVLVSIKNKQIKINSNSETIDKVMIYDISGKLIYKKEKANTQEVIISTLTAKNQVLIVKTTLQNGKTLTDKIVN